MSDDFAAAYDAHVWDIYGFFAYRLGNRSDAKDLTQRTFEKALRGWNRFEPGRGEVRAWLAAIARNVLIDHYRTDKSRRHRQLEQIPEAALGLENPYDLGVSPQLASALNALTDRDREVIALRFGADLTTAQIAEVTELSVANVQQVLSRSLRKLRALLD